MCSVRPRSPPLTATSRSGFTIAELLVTLTILALVTAIVAPRVLAPSPVREQRQAAAMLVDAARSARTQARLEGRERLLLIDVGERTLSIAPSGPIRRLPRSVELTVTAARSETDGDLAGVRFFPDGASTGADIVLSAEGVEARLITVSWATGLVTMEAGDGAR